MCCISSGHEFFIFPYARHINIFKHNVYIDGYFNNILPVFKEINQLS